MSWLINWQQVLFRKWYFLHSVSVEVLNSFGNRVEKQSKELYLTDGFSFKTELTANRVVKSIETLARVNNTIIPATDITVDRSIASEFLPS